MNLTFLDPSARRRLTPDTIEKIFGGKCVPIDTLPAVKSFTFKEAVLEGKMPQGNPTLLLGNGFSMAYDANIFSYRALLGSVDWSNSGRVREIFNFLKTVDFEVAIRNLDTAADIADIYDPGGKYGSTLRHDANFLKEALICAIQATHPAHIFEIDQSRITSSARFLRNFGRVFTVNYDLLLYWALVQSGLNLFSDGFKQGDNGLEWADFPNQSILYLHGALHLFQTNGRLEKIKYYAGDGGRLIEQVASRIASGNAPLFVCEGTSEQKLVHIKSSRYLRFCFSMLSKTQGSLFIHGLSLSESDGHILSAIATSPATHLFISLHGDPDSQHNREIQAKASEIQHLRPYRPLRVDFYEADSAELW